MFSKYFRFSLSLLAQLESGFLIGGIGVYGLLNFLFFYFCLPDCVVVCG
jgi:hypothetical protein